MRTAILACLLTTTIHAACGDDGPSKVPPRVIPGGGIGDGPIDGVVNVYAIDDATREPVAGATVVVETPRGDVEGTTDDTGLFIAEVSDAVETVTVKADPYRPEMWVGANGANMTFNLEKASEPVAPRASLMGSIDLTSIQVPQGHLKLAIVFYSQTDDLGDPENEIVTANDTHVCNGGTMGNPMPCNFTIDVRPGKVGLLAAVYDRNLNNTPTNPNDDTMTLIRWAYRGGITVTAGVSQSGQDLTLVDVGMMGNVTVDFGSPPSSLATQGALIGLETGTDGVFQLPLFRTPADATLLAPKPAAVGGTAYRLTAIANNATTSGTPPVTQETIVLRRGLSGATLAAGTWLAVPEDTLGITRGFNEWKAVPDATVMSLEFTQGTAKVLNVTSFDGTTSFVVPDIVALPAGALTVKLNAISAPGFDVTDFSLDEDEDKLDRVSSRTFTLD